MMEELIYKREIIKKLIERKEEAAKDFEKGLELAIALIEKEKPLKRPTRDDEDEEDRMEEEARRWRQEHPFKSINETGKMFNLPVGRLRQMQKEGKLPGFYTGARFYVNINEFKKTYGG